MQHTLVFVDDEQTIVDSLRRVFIDDDYEILTATTGAQAIELVRNNKVSLIITDMRMPGMDGVQVMEHVSDISPDTVRLVLTGYADKETTVNAINRGRAHHYLLKPWDNEEIRLLVAQYLGQYELKHEVTRLQALTASQNEQLRRHNEELEEMVQERTEEITKKNQQLESVNEKLKGSYYSTVKVLGNTIEMFDPALGSHGIRVAAHALLLGRMLGLDNEYCNDIYVAALLHDIGLIGVSPGALKKYNRRQPMDESERALIHQHTQMGEKLIMLNPSRDRVAKMIRQHHENYDGSGYPDGLSGLNILVGAQVIAVADRYDEILCRFGNKPDSRLHQEAINFLQDSRRLYDGDVIELYLELLKHDKMRAYVESEIPLSDLHEDMMLARHLYSSNGLLLLARGSKISKDQLERLKFGQLLPADAKIHIYDVQFNALAESLQRTDSFVRAFSTTLA